MVMSSSSSPPEYQTLSQHDPDESFSSKAHYPPQNDTIPDAGEGSGSSMPRDDAGELITVTYTFVPRYPVKGDKQNALGVLYPDKLKTAAAVRRIFYPLQSYDLDRIEILAPVEINGETKWGVVMDEAWPRMVSEVHPKRLKVQIADGPGDAEARGRRKGCLIITATGAGVVLTLFTLLLIAGLARHS